MAWNWKHLLRATAALAFAFVPFSGADLWLYDRFLNIRGAAAPSQDVLIVTFSEDEPPAFPEKVAPTRSFRHAWENSRHGRLLRDIVAQRPALVAFVSPFDGYVRGTEADYLMTEKSLHGEVPVLFAAPVDEEERVLPPVRELVHGENFGFAHLFPDADNVVRRVTLLHDSSASIALLAYQQLRTQPIRHSLLKPLQVDFRGPAGNYQTFASEELSRPGNASILAGRLVIVGRAENTLRQAKSPLGRMPRAELQANILDTILSGREIATAPRAFTVAFSLAAVALAILLMLTAPVATAWLALCGLGLLILCISFATLTQFKMWLPVSNTLLCLLVTFVLFVGTRLRAQERKHWQVEQESEALREMDRFKNNFISLFSHDLRTPLARIQANLDHVLSRSKSLDPDFREAMLAIQRANGDLARLISDILKVTRMESMRLEPALEVVDLNRLVEESVASLRDAADEKKIRLVLDLEPLFSMEGDPTLLREVVSNLVENAIKYSPDGTVVTIRTREVDGRVSVAVADQGIGIPVEELPRVTGKFYRGKSVTASHKGTGLGLYLSKYFVELHGGELSLESRVGQGTTVAFSLPLPG